MKTAPKILLGLAAFSATVAAQGASPVATIVEGAEPEQPITVALDLAKRGFAVPKTLYGIFFEDINYAGDGGLYPEKLVNRGFDWQTKTLEGWERDFRGGSQARVTVVYGRPVHPNTAAHLRIECFGVGEGGGCGVRNKGFHGISVKAGETDRLSFYARGLDGWKGSFRVVLENGRGGVLCERRVSAAEIDVGAVRKDGVFPLPEWTCIETEFTPSETADDATLSILLDNPGVVEFEMVSLYPKDAWGGRRNGLRKDLVQMLKDIKPGILRFPGGCITEGNDWDEWYDWKTSVGDGTLESRRCFWNRWGYWQDCGLGYFEYFQLAEDIGAEPLPVMNAAMTCQFAHPWDIAPMDAIDYFVKNFLDLVEFANGDPEKTEWGAVRAKMGHPKPFNLKYVGVGNENWGPEFIKRFSAISKAILAKHPGIRIVGSSGPQCGGADYDLAWREVKGDLAYVIDEHYYMPPAWFLGNTRRYDPDNFPRGSGRPGVYAGEYAAHDHWHGKGNTLLAAMSEAAFMTGLERNCDVVKMASYAPLFAKEGNTQWTPDLIWYDNAKSWATPSYHVQKLFANNLPTYIVPSDCSNRHVCKAPPSGGFALQTWSTSAEFKNVVVKDGTGKVVYSQVPDPNAQGRGRAGRWSVDGEVLRQSNENGSDNILPFGPKDLDSFTLSLSARRVGGKEGFILHSLASGVERVSFNFGGWGNTRSAVEGVGYSFKGDTGEGGGLEDGRWYDVVVEYVNGVANATVDGRPFFTDVEVKREPIGDFYQVCGYDEEARELVVKLVNRYDHATQVALDFGRALPAATLALTTLTADDLGAANGKDRPDAVAPVRVKSDFKGGRSCVLSLPKWSVNVVRIPVNGGAK